MNNALRAVVCDADAVSLRLLARLVNGAGFTVTTAMTAAAATAAVEELEPALAVLAILLPDLDGLQLTRTLRLRWPNAFIVVASVLPAAQRALEAGADAFLLKPVQAGRLIAVIQHRQLSGGGVHDASR